MDRGLIRLHRSRHVHSACEPRQGSPQPPCYDLFVAQRQPMEAQPTSLEASPTTATILRSKRAVRPVCFPVEALVPESKRHFELRTALYQVLKASFASRACIGSDQFVYWNAADPSRCLAPDVFVRLGTPDVIFDSWKTWERGAPELAVELVSHCDASESVWESKLGRYHELGVRELVRFDGDADAGERIRVWDRIDGDLVERALEHDRTPSVLDLVWCVAPIEEHSVGLRLEDLEGTLVPLPVERERADAERQKVTAEHERANAEREKRRADEALERVAELEAELARRAK